MLVIQVIVALDEVIWPAATTVITGGATALLTVTETLFVAVFPPVSIAIALRTWEPLMLLLVSQDVVYDGPPPATIAPRFVPSTWN